MVGRGATRDRQTTNLGVGSSNLPRCANEINKIRMLDVTRFPSFADDILWRTHGEHVAA